MMTEHKTLYINDYELMKADIEAADAIMERCLFSDNPNLRCIAAYQYTQAIEKALRAIIRVEDPELFNECDRFGIRYIHKTHDIAALLNNAEACRPGLIEKHKYIAKNDERLTDFNNLRFGTLSISMDELRSLAMAARALVDELEHEFLEKHPDKKKNAQMGQEQWDKRAETDFRDPIIKSSEQLTTSISGRAITQKDYDLINARIEAADAVLNAARTSQNRYMMCLAGFHFGDTAQIELKAILRVDRPDYTDEEGNFKLENSHEIDKLLTKAELQRPGLLAKYAFFGENSEQIQYISRLRYGSKTTTEEEVKALAIVVKALCNELNADFEAENPDKKLVAKSRRIEWDHREKANLQKPEFKPAYEYIDTAFEERKRAVVTRRTMTAEDKISTGSKSRDTGRSRDTSGRSTLRNGIIIKHTGR